MIHIVHEDNEKKRGIGRKTLEKYICDEKCGVAELEMD